MKTASPSFFLLLLARLTFGLAPSGPWDAFNYAPKSKTVYPAAIREIEGTVTNSELLVNNAGSATLSGQGTWIALDFGVEVPAPLATGHWTQPSFSLRGGFRFLTIVSTSAAAVTISNVSCSISFMPHVDDLRAYTGYFSAPDPGFHDPNFLTKIWMAGAYTVQTNTVALHTGRQVPFASAGHWANNATLGVAGPIIVDGDMGIAVPTQFVSTNDLMPTRNALATMFAAINPTTGALPESGPPLSQLGSDTYHCWTLIGTHNYYLYSGDIEWLESIWTNYTKAVAFLEAKVDPTVGLMNVSGLRDWARLGGGGFNAEGNASDASLASAMNLPSLAAAWTKNATTLKANFNDAFWVEELGMYRDNVTTTLCPQDANSFAVLFNITTSTDQATSISAGLEKNWNNLGPVAPELPDTISPFISGFELQAHFVAGNASRAMDLLHREWGYMLYTNLSVESSLLEGFTANGSIWYRSYRGYNFDPAYTSHAHGWSSGPTSALTIYVLGLSRTWLMSPRLAGLPSAEGGFETALGWFGASWNVSTSGATITLTVDIDVPSGTSGVFEIPEELRETSRGLSVTLDGKKYLKTWLFFSLESRYSSGYRDQVYC
ncbi:glycoside hydrolase family 78 protein [Mycena vulgaris]|nr:glycoside hydrolase family 78 protein [Mycena vulgaris]